MSQGVCDWRDVRPPLSSCCLKAIESLEFTSMTPVQSATIPYFMQNKDVAVEAVTGSGKTLAFVIPVVEILLRRPEKWTKTETGAVVLSPTRELAVQTASVFRQFLPDSLSLCLLIGGQDIHKDLQTVNQQGAQVIVATPGRLSDLLGRNECSLAGTVRALEVLVLDEADRLLELGFEQTINTILCYLPKQRRTGLFSATMTQDVKALMRSGLRNPVTISVRDKTTDKDLAPTPKSLHNYFMVCDPEEKIAQLISLLTQFQGTKVIVFFATCASVSYFATLTKRLLGSTTVLALHGRMHTKRQQLFSKFFSQDSAVLMCTDVMARGVDFPRVDWVIQFDPPSSAKAFVHRCGRTARMGLVGRALVMLLPNETSYVEFLSLNQHVSLLPFSPEASPQNDILTRARELAAREREVYEQSIRAFVSFVHFYYKHECKVIFSAKDLDLVSLAKGFALLHLPKMPELKSVDTSSFSPHPVDITSIPYKDKAREKQRRAKMRRESEGTSVKRKRVLLKQKAQPWKRRREQVKKPPRKRKREEFSAEELSELAREARLLKKFKAGKITKARLEEELGD